MNADLLFLLSPTSSKGFSLSFAGGSLPSGATFSRASSGTYFNSSGVITSASTDVARFDYNPSTLAVSGLVYEASRATTVYYSAFTYPTATLCSAATNNATAPDGTTTACKINDSGTGTHYLYAGNSGSYTFVSGTVYCFSVFAKAGTSTVLQLSGVGTRFTNRWANFNLSTGSAMSNSGCTAYGIDNYGGGWYRCWVALQCDSGGSVTSSHAPICLFTNSTDSGYSLSYAATGQYFWLWGAQTEVGSYPTSYIPTNGSAATRAVDQLSFTIPSGVNYLTYTFDDDSTQKVAVSAGAYTVPTTLNRAWIKTIKGTAT